MFSLILSSCLSYSTLLFLQLLLLLFYFCFPTPKVSPSASSPKCSVGLSSYSERSWSWIGWVLLFWKGGAHEQTDSCREIERERERERVSERATAVTVWLLGALYMPLIPGWEAQSSLSCREISEPLNTKTTTLKVKFSLFFCVKWQLLKIK